LSPGRPSSENLEVLAEKVGTLDLKTIKKRTAALLTRSRLGRRGMQRPLPRTLQLANLSRAPQKGGPHLKAIRLRPCRSPEHLGTKQKGKRNYQSVGLV